MSSGDKIHGRTRKRIREVKKKARPGEHQFSWVEKPSSRVLRSSRLSLSCVTFGYVAFTFDARNRLFASQALKASRETINLFLSTLLYLNCNSLRFWFESKPGKDTALTSLLTFVFNIFFPVYVNLFIFYGYSTIGFRVCALDINNMYMLSPWHDNEVVTLNVKYPLTHYFIHFTHPLILFQS